MARITPDEVKEIMIGSSLTNEQIDPFILAAHLHINEVFASSTVTPTRLREIERWFTAHIIASVADRTTETEKIGDAQVTYVGKFGEGLKSTPYGQMVLQLDTSGLMSVTGKLPMKITAIESFD